MRCRFFTTICLGTALWLAAWAPLGAQSNIIAPSPGYQATDQLTSIYPSGFDVSGNSVAVYAGGQLDLYNRTTGSLVSDLGDANYDTATTTYNSFVKFDPSGQSIWVGYTVGGDTNDQIFQVTNLLSTTPTWNYVATFPSNYDLAFSGDVPYVSGPNSTALGAANAIWRLDTSGANQPTEVAAVGGFAAGLAFDSSGNLYYGTDFGSNDELVEFTAAQLVQQAKTGSPLTLAEATGLTALPGSAADVAVDGAGHVLFTTNGTVSTLGMWDGTAGSGDNYTVMGTGPADFYTFVRATGDVTTAAGAAYVGDFYNPGLAQVTHLLPGDAIGDGTVDINDLTIVLAHYGQTGMTWSQGEFTGDGTVDINDLTIVLANYGQTAGAAGRPATVPEPAAAVLLAAAAVVLLAGLRLDPRVRKAGDLPPAP